MGILRFYNRDFIVAQRASGGVSQFLALEEITKAIRLEAAFCVKFRHMLSVISLKTYRRQTSDFKC